MSENKEYVTQAIENGSIHISEEVIVSIAAMAAMDVEGVCGLSEPTARLGKKVNNKGIRVVISENDEISIDCYLVVLYGCSVVDVAKAVQESIGTMVESTTGCKVKSVNVSISGIALSKEKK